MSEGLDVIIVDDDQAVCELISTVVKRFYTWGEVLPFTDPNKAITYCLERDIGVAIFVVDVFLGVSAVSFFWIPSRKSFQPPTLMPSSSPAMQAMISSICASPPM
jgi:hypothetical protein